MSQPVRVGICSTYAPRACGLATFSADLERSLRLCAEISEVGIIALVNEPSNSEELSVVAEIGEQKRGTYSCAARVANKAFDVVIVQHEFGIYGGHDGEYVLRFLADLRVPAIITLHTVLPTFSSKQVAILRRACDLAAVVTVFTPTAVGLLLDQKIVRAQKIHVIPHDAPDALYGCDRQDARERLQVDGKYVLSTFGLLSPGKGLELAIAAMSLAAKKRPDLLFIAAGKTHPGVRRVDGETYRQVLTELVTKCGLESHVRFIDEFLSIEGIAELLAATDVFITPYVNPEQSVSGALTFALAAGLPVVSTPYRYAMDQLSSGAGIIVPHRQPEAVSEAVLRFANDEHFRDSAAQEASRIGSAMRWTTIARRIAALAFDQCRGPNIRGKYRHDGRGAKGDDRVVDISNRWSADRLPAFAVTDRPLAVGAAPSSLHDSTSSTTRRLRSLESSEHPAAQSTEPLRHLLRLIDDTGIIQHATGRMPLRSTGYCVDDVARLLPVALIQSDLDNPARLPTPPANWDAIAARCVSFIFDAIEGTSAEMQPTLGNRPGSMHNFLAFDRTWLGVPSYGDHVGRAAMALAAAASQPEYETATASVLEVLFRSIRPDDPIHLRAYMLLAQTSSPSLSTREETSHVAKSLLRDLDVNQGPNWVWFEQQIRYDAAVLPTALIRAGQHLGDSRLIDGGLRSLDWLHAVISTGSSYRFPGHLGLKRGADVQTSGDEQPLEARAFVDACVEAHRLTGDGTYRGRAFEAFGWFQGRNRLGIAMTGHDGGCFDGLGRHHANQNSGAESSLAYITASMTIRSLLAADPASASTIIHLGTRP